MSVSTSAKTDTRDPVRHAIVTACRYMMQPIARFLMKNGVTFKEFSEVAKAAFVEVATKEYGIRNRPTNVSRTAVLTGLTRKEVKRIRDVLVRNDGALTPEQGRPAQLLTLWFSSPQFLTEDGTPRELDFEGENGFRDLCRLAGGDVPPGALLTELKRAGAIDEKDDGKIRALKRHFNPAGTDEYQARRFGECLHDLADTVEHNLSASGDSKRRFESRVWNDSVPSQFASRFEAIARDQGKTLLEMLDDWLTAHQSDDTDAEDLSLHRCGVGIYFFDSEDRRS